MDRKTLDPFQTPDVDDWSLEDIKHFLVIFRRALLVNGAIGNLGTNYPIAETFAVKALNDIENAALNIGLAVRFELLELNDKL